MAKFTHRNLIVMDLDLFDEVKQKLRDVGESNMAYEMAKWSQPIQEYINDNKDQAGAETPPNPA